MDPLNGLTGIDTVTQQDAVGLLLPLYLGWQAQLLLFGLCLSLFHDYQCSEIYCRHSKRMKISLWTIMGFLSLVSLLSFEETIYFAVWQRRTFEDVVAAHWPSGVEPLLTGCVAAGVQILLTLRASAFFPPDWRRAFFLAFVWSLVALSLAGSAMTTAVGYMYFVGTVEQSPFSFSTATLIWLVPAAAADVSISLGLLYTLRKRANNGIAGWAFRSLIATAVRTASYTAVMAVGGAALSIVAILKNQSAATIDLPFALWVPMPSLYVLSLFTTLSSNKAISRRLVERQDKTAQSGFLPGRLAVSYMPDPITIGRSPRPGSPATTATSDDQASQLSAEGRGKEKEEGKGSEFMRVTAL